jgi:hypothetical protein
MKTCILQRGIPFRKVSFVINLGSTRGACEIERFENCLFDVFKKCLVGEAFNDRPRNAVSPITVQPLLSERSNRLKMCDSIVQLPRRQQHLHITLQSNRHVVGQSRAMRKKVGYRNQLMQVRIL